MEMCEKCRWHLNYYCPIYKALLGLRELGRTWLNSDETEDVKDLVIEVRVCGLFEDYPQGGFCGPGLADFLKEALDNHKG